MSAANQPKLILDDGIGIDDPRPETRVERLQINLSGSWRNVLSFDGRHQAAVKLHAGQLADLAMGPPKLRILGAADTVLLYWDHKRGWHLPHWKE